MPGVWTTRGFEAFCRGTFGDAGKNLYVSRAGVLQRIHCFDLSGDGYLYLPFCNSQEHWETPPAYVSRDLLAVPRRRATAGLSTPRDLGAAGLAQLPPSPLAAAKGASGGRLAEAALESGSQPAGLPTEGARCGVVADLNEDGHDDQVLGMYYNGARKDLNACIYYGSPQGLAEARRQLLPAPACTAVAAGDFDGDGQLDLAFLSMGKVRVFYQTVPAFEPKGFVDLEVSGDDLAAHDLDGDGYADLVVRQADGQVIIYWGGPEGIAPGKAIAVPIAPEASPGGSQTTSKTSYLTLEEPMEDARPLVKVLQPGAVDALYCDLNDDGHADLIVANASENSVWRDPGSYVYLNGPRGLLDKPDWRLPTARAMSVACADLNRDGYLDLVFCGFMNPELLIFYGGPDGLAASDPARIRLEYDGYLLSEPRTLHVADLNNDGWLDLFVPDIVSDRSVILRGGPDGFSLERRQLLSVRHACCARTADLTGNGYLDLLVGGHQPSPDGPHDSFVYIYWNGPDGLREDNRALLPANAVNAMTLADFDNDGRLDLFVGSYHGTKERDIDSYIYWNRAGRGFSATDRTRLFTHSASGVVAADPNEDGWVDLAIAYHKVLGDHVGYSAVWWNGPDGLDERRVTKLPTSGPRGMISVEPRNTSDGGAAEFYTSRPYALPEHSQITQIAWLADIPAKTWVCAQLRTAVSEAVLDATPWEGAQGTGSWFENGDSIDVGQFGGPWIQYRLALGAVNAARTPRVREVSVSYT